MDSNNFESTCINPSAEFLHRVEPDFLSIDTQLNFENERSMSLGETSLDGFEAISAGATSPMTPMGHMPIHNFYGMDGWVKTEPQDAWHIHNTDSEGLWLAPDGSTMANCVMNTFTTQTSTSQFQPGYFCPMRPKSAIDPPLSRAVFPHALAGCRGVPIEEDLPWPTSALITQPQTVAPSATFQMMLPSSPMGRVKPVTPLQHYRDSSYCSSSPPSCNSSSILASQWETEESKYDLRDEVEAFEREVMLPYETRDFCNSATKVEDQSPKKSLPAKSGVNCEAVIRQNEFACSFKGCIDKNGRQKRFKRQEHRKRHEKTVHGEQGGHGPRPKYPCWVVTGNKRCGRDFSRKDNLNSHLLKTHGRKSNSQRNSYVATLDSNSKYYDKDWVGSLTAEGLPIDPARWPDVQLRSKV
ncbi:hypothetical protein LTR64_006717 [Lithohypha guttulata]|uniref:uncharacterized protein n=1 Tax=Lithohypha guttulata TaxID=1690604 RepID=UPI00315C4EBF